MKIAVVTVGRSDYGILRPLLLAMKNSSDISTCLLVGDGHLSKEHGETINEIRGDGLEVASIIAVAPKGDDGQAMAMAIGEGVQSFAKAFQEQSPDFIVVLGDRFEALAAVIAAQPLLIPIVHIGGGSLTEGALDDGFRHAMSKLSHLHCVETESHAALLRQMGEPEDRIHIVGALGLDNIHLLDLQTEEELKKRFNLHWDQPPLLITLHTETRAKQSLEQQAAEFFEALEACERSMVFTYPNLDTEGRKLITLIDAFAERIGPRVQIVPHFGTVGYFSAIRHCIAMVGNSSSGIIEAGAFGKPVVNIGDRQKGRLCGENVRHAPFERQAISDALAWAVHPNTAKLAAGVDHPYGQGQAAAGILQAIRRVSHPEKLVFKAFQRH